MIKFFRKLRYELMEQNKKGKPAWPVGRYIKYAIGEIVLVVIGILIALQINNWNSSNKSKREVKISITHIKKEIESNIKELNKAQKINHMIGEAYSEYRKLYDGKTTELITTPENMDILQNKYPGFFRISDSLQINTDLFHYSGTTFINLELAELTEIAWETTRSVGITNEFEYECLYELESMYNLQRRVQNEINKAANALQKREIEELMNILGFLEQLDHQLDKDYERMLVNIENCD